MTTHSPHRARVPRLRRGPADLSAENRRLRRALARARAESGNDRNLRTFFDTVDHLLCVLDTEGRILAVNATVTRKLGYRADELVGESVLLIHPPERRDEAAHIVAEMLAGRTDRCPVPLMTKDGRQIPAETRVVLGTWSGREAVFGMTRDLSGLAASEEKFSKAFHSSPAAMALSDLASGTLADVNLAFLRILGFAREEVIGKTSLELGLWVDPEQRAAIVARLAREGALSNLEVLVRCRDGRIRHGLFSVERLRLQDCDLLLTVMTDITERRAMEAALRERELLYRIVADNTHDWEFWERPDGRLVYCSPSCRTVTGRDAEELLQDPDALTRIVHPDDRAAFARHRRTTHDTKRRGAIELRILLPDGKVRWIGHVCQPVFDGDGVYLGIRGSNRDIDRQKEAERKLLEANRRLTELQEQLREQALRDPLTGLHNRRYLQETAPGAFARAARQRAALSLIVLDMDGLKKINDTHGHPIGDAALKSLARALTRCLRAEDTICRCGGDEMIVLLVGASAEVALRRLGECRALLERWPLRTTNGAETVVRFSAGVACFPQHGASLEDLTHCADIALYRAKAHGRDAVLVYEPDAESHPEPGSTPTPSGGAQAASLRRVAEPVSAGESGADV